MAARSGGWRVPSRRRKSGLLARNFGVLALVMLSAFGAARLWAPDLLSTSPSGTFTLPTIARPSSQAAQHSELVAQAYGRHFAICGQQARIDCVVDGDTFYLAGERIRIADIDAPEVSSPGCHSEALLGARATQRLQAFLNAGGFELRRGDRDRDRYGRSLRTVHRDGRSIGDRLVAEGLARPWDGRRRSWCG